MKRIVLLGATGSIGRQTCEVVAAFPEEFQMVGASCGSNRAALNAVAERFAISPGHLAFGEESKGLAKLDCDLVVVAIPGAASLRPAIAALEAGHDLALASKEVLVMAGELVTRICASTGARLWPIDSEHCAIAQCLRGEDASTVRRLVITASGGPFWQLPKDQWSEITIDQALKHPTWSMGKKVTIDSATMMNKGLEIIEARWLFGIDADRIDAVIQPQSLVHAMVEFCDGATIAQVAPADMRIPISYALSGGRRLPDITEPVQLTGQAIEFHSIDQELFPAPSLARAALRAGGCLPVIMSAADEAAVGLFLEHRLSFAEIVPAVEKAMAAAPHGAVSSMESVISAAAWARDFVSQQASTGAIA
jgi:1-deoxy-D-xylulose-5-phosphate reductoisomerase